MRINVIFFFWFVFQLQTEHLDCGAAHLQHPLAIRRTLMAVPMFKSPGLSSVAVDSVHDHTVVFLGTSNGRLHKVRGACVRATV